MALPESAFQKPYWIRYKEGATLARDDKRRFDYMEIAYASYPREWRIEPQPGHNAQNPSTKVDKVSLTVDTPYIRAR
jgi:hypothetical protein